MQGWLPPDMARLAPWLRHTERELRRREPTHGQEEDEEGFEEHVDEHGVTGLDKRLVAVSRRPRGSHLTGIRSFGCRELQELGQEAAGANGQDTRSPTPGDIEDSGDRTVSELSQWHSGQDVTGEEEEEQGSLGGEEVPEGTSGAESDGDLYVELSDEGQCSSTCSGSPEAPRDGPAPRSPRKSSPSASMDSGDMAVLWDISPSPSLPWDYAPGLAGESQRRDQSLLLHLLEPEPCGESDGEPQGRTSAAGPTAVRGPRGARHPLKHPLPDLSKVEARVRFARGYRPPRGRAPLAVGPALRPSPAEVVREALRSSPCRRPVPAAGHPRPFACPREATELVQQLEDDYHKLLTKYAEAENTIDQLRLGAKVSLYADPPRPSHSVRVGTLGTGSKVMAFSIPRARAAAISAAPVPALQPSLHAEPAQGPVNQGTPPRPGSPPFPAMGCSAGPGECGCRGQHPCPGARLTHTLAGQTCKFQAQVESFEAWVQAGMSTPQEQLQRFRKLKDTQDALERTYLQAREENRRLQQHPDASGGFDPDRMVEGEIFCLGLRLEELKDRLEQAAQGQCCPRSCSEVASSCGRSPGPLSRSSTLPSPQAPTPAGGSPLPESPALQEMLPSTRLGTGLSSESVESEVGEEELPEPLWHKRLQVEKDFGDLLEQYKHFKSLPGSLSLEQLRPGGSQSLEEVDGLMAGELDKVSCRTPSPEESSDLHTSPLQPVTEPAWTKDRLSCAGSGEAPGAARAAKAPAGLREPQGLRGPLSRCGGDAAPGHQLRQAKPMRGEEQRMVSPETDSGFVGSEASRVSLLTHVPEQRPPHAGTAGSLRRSGPVSMAATLHPRQMRGPSLLRSGKALTGIYATRGHGPCRDDARGSGLPPSTHSQSSSLSPWADSVISEMAPNAAGAHTDSALEERSCVSSRSHPPGKSREPAGLAATTLSPNQAHRDLLGSRMERDWAIHALQDEVLRLQHRLEESLHRPRSYPGGEAPLRTAKARRQPLGDGLFPEDPAPSEAPSAAVRDRPAPARRGRSTLLPWDTPELLLQSERLPGRPREAAPSAQKSPQSPTDTATVRGRYTGTQDPSMPLVPPAPRAELGALQCPQCATSVGDKVRWLQQSTPRMTCCPTCHSPWDSPVPNPSDRAAHAEHSSDAAASPASRVGSKAKMLEQPGLWYLAASSPAAALGYLAPLPVVAYTPSVLYCSPAVSTSAPVLAGLQLHPAAGYQLAERAVQAPRQHAASRRLSLDLDDLEELNWSLSRAVEAAKSVKFTTKQMSRSLTSELSKVQDLQGSCLF